MKPISEEERLRTYGQWKPTPETQLYCRKKYWTRYCPMAWLVLSIAAFIIHHLVVPFEGLWLDVAVLAVFIAGCFIPYPFWARWVDNGLGVDR